MVAEKISVLLEQKKERFLAYEAETLALLESTPDAAENYITKRDEIANEIDELNEKIGRLCDETPHPALLMDIVAARCNYEVVPTEYRPLYTLGQEVRGVMFRISEADARVLETLGAWQEEARDKIKQNQHLPKIKNYLTNLSSGPAGNASLTDEKA